MHRALFLVSLLSSFLFSDGENDGFTYLQSLRQKASMISFTRNSLLDKASSNHSNYLKLNNAGGHIESIGKPGFTGAKPSDRVKQVGLYSKTIGENVSTGQADFRNSIDDLFTAIYHRLGFLDVTYNMVGLGKKGDRYSYLMSNSDLEDTCKNEPGESAGRLICHSNKAFGDTKVDGLKRKTADSNPKVIIWPPDNYDDNPPHFYEESPDPLPNHEVSGNPISILFNKYYYPLAPTLTSFKLLDADNKEVRTILRSKANAINKGYLDEYVFVLFPDKRLNWNSTYKIEYNFSSSKGAIQGTSTFKTRELQGKVYHITDKNAEIRVIANTKYTIDLVPLNADDNSLAKGYGGGGSAQADGFKAISSNTFQVTIKGSIGSYIEYKFGGDARSVKMVVSDSDDTGENDGGNDSGSKIDIAYTRGWNLNALLDKTVINNTKDYFKNFDVLYTYNGTQFIFNPSKITYKEAYFVYYGANKTNSVPFKENETYEIDINSLKRNSWNLVPVGKNINNPSEYFGSNKLYVLQNSEYKNPSSTLKRGQALWVKK